MSFREDNRSQKPSVSVQTSGTRTFKDYAFYGVIGFFCISTLGAIVRMIDPESGAKLDAQNAQQTEVITKKAAPSTSFKATAFEVSADPGVEYVIFDVVKRQDNLIEVSSRRKGSSGTSYARRLVNCQNWTFMYLSEGDTIDELSILHPDSKMSKLTQGSSSTAVSYNGCRSAGLIN